MCFMSPNSSASMIVITRSVTEGSDGHEPASDTDTAVVDSLKALDLERPIREADIPRLAEPGRASGSGLRRRKARMILAVRIASGHLATHASPTDIS